MTVGPYSVVRNPLYVFSIIGAAGAGAQHGSVVVALTLSLLAWLVFYVVLCRRGASWRPLRRAVFAGLQGLPVPRFCPAPAVA